jgi:DNA-binding NarL/FixJ family response regulator
MTEKPASPVRVLVVDDQQLVRDGIASLLQVQEGIDVIGTATNGQEALEHALARQPDVILMDVRMPIMDGVTATRHIRQQVPACHILVLTTFDDDDYVREALQAGAQGYLLKDLPASDLAKAVQAAAQGIYQLDPSIGGKVMSALGASALHAASPPTPASGSGEPAPRPSGAAHSADLTNREIEVLRLIATGATNREIAERLVISEGTVKNHVSNMFSRLGLRDRTQAVMYARERGLL